MAYLEYELLSAISAIESERDINRLRRARNAIEEKACDDQWSINLDVKSGAYDNDEIECAEAFNKVLWALRDALDLKIKERESLWVGVEGIATIA